MESNDGENETPVVIVGGGLAGLGCAKHLVDRGVACRVLEASDAVGGRARTDTIDGYLCDRGFQVFLPAYPDAKRLLDYDRLELKPFEPGALIRYRGKFHRFSDPWRRPQHALATALAPVATLADKIRIARLRSRVQRGSLEDRFRQLETSTEAYLERLGFSQKTIDAFFRPFLGGIFLDPSLATSSRMFEFVFRMFAQGPATLPARGMGQIAQQLADRLPAGAVSLQTSVERIDRGGVTLMSGERINAAAVVSAVDQSTAAKLLDDQPESSWRGTTCLYFAAERPPLDEAILVLNGDGPGGGPINSLCVPSAVAPGYAPAGRALVSVSVVGQPEMENEAPLALVAEVTNQLRDWYGPQVDGWGLVHTCRVPLALPAQPPGWLEPAEKPVERADGVFRCGDYLETASIQGALASGRRAAEAVAGRLARAE